MKALGGIRLACAGGMAALRRFALSPGAGSGPIIAAALAAGNATQAEQLAEAALADNGLAPVDRKAVLLVARGTAREAQARHDDALVDLTQAIEMHVLPPEEQARALFTRGAILDVQGHANDAIGDYSAALVLSPRYAPALNNRANDYRRLHHVAEAKRDYLAALAAGNPAPEYSYYGLGQIAEAEGNRQGARGFYAQAVAANPNYALAAERLSALGGALGGLGPAETSIIHLRPPGAISGTVSDSVSGTAPDAPPAPVVLKPPGDIQLHPPRVTPASYSGRQVC